MTMLSGSAQVPADAVQVVRQRVAELGSAADVEVAEAVARRLVQDAPDGLHPDLTRELGDVRPAVAVKSIRGSTTSAVLRVVAAGAAGSGDVPATRVVPPGRLAR